MMKIVRTFFIIIVIACVAVTGVFAADEKLIGLGFTPTELMYKMNNFSKKEGLPSLISDIEKLPGSPEDINDVYRSTISENLIIQMTTHKGDKNINAIAVIATPKNNDESMLTMMTYGTIIAACSPHANTETRGKMLLTLMQDENGNLNKKQSIGMKDVKYTFSSSEITGLMFFVENRTDADR